MKKFYLGMLAVLLTFFTSCQFSENIYINEDGTGKMSFTMDGSELMDMMGDEMAKDGEESIDSIISFNEFFKEQADSIAKLPQKEQDKLKQLENFKMHMIMSTEDKKMSFDLFTEFKNVGELQDMFAAMNTAGSLDKNNNAGSNPLASMGSNGATEVNYSLKNNVFKRTVTILDKEKVASMKDSLGQSATMFAASNYTLNYHFPRKIKSVSLEDAVISDDGKSFSAKVNFMQYLTDPKLLNVEVELEK
ncbi:hypothetical protein IMCC3317_21260 [Kordia antarctica]|uniref:Lipoprotein n=1 Tax=Kordia antarctica TaxID=1218801 RepID=A0A7L4ZKK9_9FLAO|nr:hypothetical protein [Kordia antarctica]QHI36756.1 hypothetical protein IMCC3317_21260 [Kordia antarctica]